MTTPDPRRIRAVQRRLRLHQGAFIPKPPLPIIDEVVATVLSSSACRIASRCTSPRRRTAIGSWAWVISGDPHLTLGVRASKARTDGAPRDLLAKPRGGPPAGAKQHQCRRTRKLQPHALPGPDPRVTSVTGRRRSLPDGGQEVRTGRLASASVPGLVVACPSRVSAAGVTLAAAAPGAAVLTSAFLRF